MTKQEVSKRVLKDGQPLSLYLFEWDSDNKVFSSSENGLVLDFKGIDGVTFNTGYDCTFNTGYDCTFNIGDNCAFNTGSDCTFETGDNCIFKTGFDCTLILEVIVLLKL